MSTESLTPSTDDFAAMLEASLAGRDLAEGQVVKGTVTSIENDVVVVDVVLRQELGSVPAPLAPNRKITIGKHNQNA